MICAPQLKSKDGKEPIGRISKQWSGLLKEVFTDTDNFGIQFPMDLDVKMKAVLMGACFLIVSPSSHPRREGRDLSCFVVVVGVVVCCCCCCGVSLKDLCLLPASGGCDVLCLWSSSVSSVLLLLLLLL